VTILIYRPSYRPALPRSTITEIVLMYIIVACGVPEISTYVNTKIAKITNLVNLDEADNV